MEDNTSNGLSQEDLNDYVGPWVITGDDDLRNEMRGIYINSVIDTGPHIEMTVTDSFFDSEEGARIKARIIANRANKDVRINLRGKIILIKPDRKP